MSEVDSFAKVLFPWLSDDNHIDAPLVGKLYDSDPDFADVPDAVTAFVKSAGAAHSVENDLAEIDSSFDELIGNSGWSAEEDQESAKKSLHDALFKMEFGFETNY